MIPQKTRHPTNQNAAAKHDHFQPSMLIPPVPCLAFYVSHLDRVIKTKER